MELENSNNFFLKNRPKLKIANFLVTILPIFCHSVIQSPCMRKHINFKVFEKSGNESKKWGNGPKILGIPTKILGNPSKIFEKNKAEMDIQFW